jgi:hypothetical protein
MRLVLAAPLLVWTALAQKAVTPAYIPAALKALEPHENEKVLRCTVQPTKPSLNFGLRFQTGYLLEVPLVQYAGAGHTWTTSIRVTPEGGQPVYLADLVDLPMTSRPEFIAQVTGTFLLGEGRYHVDFAVADDTGRICRKEWPIVAATDRSERSVKVGIPPNTVADLSYTPTGDAPAGPPVPRRITVLMNSSPPYKLGLRQLYQPGVMMPHLNSLESVDYREALVGILSSLLERLPGTVVRLVVFDLDQQREVLRQDGFTLKDMEKAAHAADDLEHWVVTVRELQQQPDRWALLENLIKRELAEPDRADVVLFLGPRVGMPAEMPAHFLDAERKSEMRFLYLQYVLAVEGMSLGPPPEMNARPTTRPQWPGGIARIPQLDTIDLTVARLKGKTVVVHTALDFSKAIDTIKRH